MTEEAARELVEAALASLSGGEVRGTSWRSEWRSVSPTLTASLSLLTISTLMFC